MKAIKTISILATAALFAACSSDDFEPGAATASDAENISFASENESEDSYRVLGVDEKTVTVTLVRTDNTKAVTAPLSCYASQDNSAFEFPKSVTFAAGEDTATVDITVNDIQMFTDYTIQMQVDEAYTHAYESDPENVPTVRFTLQRNDFKPVGTLAYISNMYEDRQSYEDIPEESDWYTTLMYSEIKDAYRIGAGYVPNPIDFTWDQETGVCHLLDEPVVTGMDWGWGSLVYYEDAPVDDEDVPMYYDKSTKTFTFRLMLYEPSDDYVWNFYTETFTLQD